MHTFYVGLGANLVATTGRTPLATCEWAIRQLVNSCQTDLVGHSSWFRSAPIPPSSQPDFVNAVIALRMQRAPADMLQILHGIENAAGRVRSERNAARVLDLDLLAAGSLVQDDAALTLPHPRLAERAFVLLPLSEIAPSWRHPILGRTARELSEAVTDQAITRIARDTPVLHVPDRWIT